MGWRESILSFLFCAVFMNGAFSQQLPFVHYTPKDGLVNSRVRAAYQDSRGRMYFLTYGGLSVYDGARFTNYTTENGMGNDVVNDVIEMGTDSLWIATNTGLLNSLVKGKLSTVVTDNKVYPIINSFYRDEAGQLFAAADDGLFVHRTDGFHKLPFNEPANFPDANRYFKSLLHIGNYLLVLKDSYLVQNLPLLYLYDLKRQKISGVFSRDIVYSMNLYGGEIWVSTAGGPKLIDRVKLARGILASKKLPEKYNQANSIPAVKIFFDHRQNMWLNKHHREGGIVKIGTNGHKEIFTVANGLVTNDINDIYEDKEGNLWFCSEEAGIHKLVNSNIQTIAHPFNASGRCTFYYNPVDHTLMYYNLEDKNLITIHKKDTTFFQPVGKVVSPMGLLHNSKGIYGLNVNSLYQYEINRKKHTYHQVPLISNPLRVFYNKMATDPFENLVIAGNDYVTAFIDNRQVFRLPVSNLSDNIAFDSHHRGWLINRLHRLFMLRIDPKNPAKYLQVDHVFDQYATGLVHPRSLCIDSEDNIWIGTRYNGLYRFKFRHNKLEMLEHLTAKEGLTDNFVTDIHWDGQENLWVSSSSGLDKLKLVAGKSVIENITRQNDIYQFVTGVTTDEKLNAWAETSSGNLISISNETKNTANFHPTLLLTSLKAGATIIDAPTEGLELNDNQNDLTFNVAAPSFYNEKQIRYSFLLKAGNNKWSEPTPNSTINFINLSPGRYQFLVRAIFPAARYPDQVMSYSFSIRPPWWQTWWFILLLILSITGILIAITRMFFQRKIQLQKKELEKQQAIEKERSRIATDMHDDLGAGLSTIRFIGEKVRAQDDVQQTIRTDIDKMVNTSNDLVEKMNQIIWAMNEKNDTLEDLLFYTRSYAMEYAEDHNLSCSFHLPAEIPDNFVRGETRSNVFLTVKESLHNIIKHAQARCININITTEKNLVIFIEDDGKGFDFSGDSRGNGLRNMKKRIETLGGKLVFTRENGTQVRIEVPL